MLLKLARAFCQQYRNPSLSTDAIVMRNRQILLITRKNPPFESKLALPGGFVDYGEDPSLACVRELEEECQLKGSDPVLEQVAGKPDRDPRGHNVSIVYSVTVQGDEDPKAADDAKTACFHDIDEIIQNPDDLAFDHYKIIMRYLTKYKF